MVPLLAEILLRNPKPETGLPRREGSLKNKLKKLLPYLTALFIVLVGYLLYNNLSSIKWDEVGSALKQTTPAMAGLAIGVSAIIYVLLASYDYLSFRYLGLTKNISYPEIIFRAFVCYAFNLNLGSLVGGLALRYRVYSRWKIDLDRIPYIIAFSTFSNWMGYCFILSLMLSFRADDMANLVPFGTIWLKLGSAVVLLLIAAYFWASFTRKEFDFRGESWKTPSPPFAFTQLVMSSIQWTLQSFIIFTLLKMMNVEVSYFQILFTFMISSVLAVFTHIPAGLGVLEVIFLRMELGIPHSKLLVALIIYRLAYYLVPLTVAVVSYAFLEIQRGRRHEKLSEAS